MVNLKNNEAHLTIHVEPKLQYLFNTNQNIKKRGLNIKKQYISNK